jgi:hypothetical protein
MRRVALTSKKARELIASGKARELRDPVLVDHLGAISYRGWKLYERPGRNPPRWTATLGGRCVSASELEVLLARVDEREGLGRPGTAIGGGGDEEVVSP